MLVSAIQLNSEYILEVIPEHYRPFILFGFGLGTASISWINSLQYEGGTE
jgi:hypothetical protein